MSAVNFKQRPSMKKYIYSAFLMLFAVAIIFKLFLTNKPEEIIFRHSLEGELEKALAELVDNFNNKDSSYKVVLEYGGNYTDSFVNTLIKGNKETRPHLLMVAEYNTPSMYHRKDDYIPINELIDVQASSFTPTIKEFYCFKNAEGNKTLSSLPFNCSTGILFYNKTAFKKAGLPDRAPETWEEMEEYCEKLKQAGYIGFTTAWPAAYIFEHFSVGS